MENEFSISCREKNLYKFQEANLEAVRHHLDKLGYSIIRTRKEYDGWMDGFKVWVFKISDRRTGEIFEVKGNDDNTALFKDHEGCGGRGLWQSIDEAASYYRKEE